MTGTRIAICLEYSIFSFGGTEVLVRELLRHLGGELKIILVSADASVADTWVAPLIEAHIPFHPGDDPEMLVRRLKESGARLVHFHLGDNYCWKVRNPFVSPISLAARAGLRCITTNHGFFSPLQGYCAHYRSVATKLALFPLAWLAKLQQLAVIFTEVAVSQYDLRGLRRWYWPLRKRFRAVYHSKLPVDLPRSSATRQKLIVCVGTIGPRKGQPLLVEAFARITSRYPDWRLELIGRSGDDEMTRAIDERIRQPQLRDRVRRVEGLSDEAVTRRLDDAEVFVMPSRFEGLGLSLQEALFHGCACIATRCGGPEDLIDHERNGLLVQKNSVTALVGALERVMAEPELRLRFRTNGPASIRAKEMSGEEMSAKYRAIYAEFLPRSYSATGN